MNDRNEAVVRLRLRGPGGLEAEVDAIVDSGFNGSLIVPSADADLLGLVPLSVGVHKLADGSECLSSVSTVEVLWGESWRPVMSSDVGAEVLLGMRLLEEHRLCLDVVPGGTIEITPLP